MPKVIGIYQCPVLSSESHCQGSTSKKAAPYHKARLLVGLFSLEYGIMPTNKTAVTGQIISFEVRGSDVLYSTSGFPKTKWQCRLISLRQSYRVSLLRILAEEFCNFPLRILAILRNRRLRLGGDSTAISEPEWGRG